MESLDVIETHILDLLCNRIINLCRHMHELFSIPKEVLSVCINACRDNVSEHFQVLLILYKFQLIFLF